MHDRGGVGRHRDELLRRARERVTVARELGEDPDRLAGCIVAVWSIAPTAARGREELRSGPLHVSSAGAFRLHRRTGVEGLALLVRGRDGQRAGGMVLRFPGEYPDSYERVEVPPGGPDPSVVWDAFFG